MNKSNFIYPNLGKLAFHDFNDDFKYMGIDRKWSREILEKLKSADDAYYNKGKPIMSDEEYDELRAEFNRLTGNSYTRIGAPVSKISEWKKATHKISMSSLNKVNTIEEFKVWATDIGDSCYLLEDKLDGMSLDLEYKDGKLVDAITRGDGVLGESILPNVMKMKNVKHSIDGITGSLRGEIFILIDDFEKLNKSLTDRDQFSNPRNTAVGVAKRYDGKYSEFLTVLFYDFVSDNVRFDTEEQRMEYIKKLGLKTCFYKKVTIKEAIEMYNAYEDKLRAEIPYDIDGLVVKANDLKLQRKLGYLNDRPKAQIAWKFTSIKKSAELLGVEWHIGRNRRYTPIALLSPNNIGGVIVKRASLANYSNFKKKNLSKGDSVLISRRGDVIPYLEEVLQRKGGTRFEVPQECPVCKSKLEVDGKYLICPNDNCEALQIGNLEKWIDALDIQDIGENIIEALYRAGKVKDTSDFYKLQISDIANLERLGEKSATKILKHLHEKMELTLPEFMGGLNMDSFSTETAKTLVEAGYDTIEKFLALTTEQLLKVKGIAHKTAEQIINGLISKRQVIKNLIDVGIVIKEQEKQIVTSNKLNGKSFCFTGGIEKINPKTGKRFKREEMQALVRENGGEMEDGVKKTLTYLVQADPSSTSDKSKRAIEFGTKILSEKQFFEMIGI